MANEDHAETRTALEDPFFKLVADTQWNACIGKQGSAENYVDGYLEAAQVLVATVMTGRMMGSRDTLAMPILYNCRHAIELSLKYLLDQLTRSGISVPQGPVDHDISALLTRLISAHVGDEAVRLRLVELVPFVKSLAQIDKDGQQLRYACDREGARSLESVALVNLKVVRYSIAKLSKILRSLKYRAHDLIEERMAGSHTARCSREDLKVIADMLGPHSSWGESSFKERKLRVRERFVLSGVEVDKAIGVIRNSAPLAAQIGIETNLLHLSDEKVMRIFETWLPAQERRADSDEGLGYQLADLHKARKYFIQADQLDGALVDMLTLEEVADLEALFYIGRGNLLGEHYAKTVTGSAAALRRLPSLKAGVHHLSTKMNLLSCVIDGITAIGRPSLAARLSEHASTLATPGSSAMDKLAEGGAARQSVAEPSPGSGLEG